MKIIISILLTVLVYFNGFAQDFSKSWIGYFSYLNITDSAQSDTKVFAVAENSVFSYDINTAEIETISTIQGLSGELISTVNYSSEHNALIIGFENGLIQVYNDRTKSVTTVVDIVQKQTLPFDLKRINHIHINGTTAYIATAFGISLYDIAKLEFNDTYIIGNGGSKINVYQTTTFNKYIYAATSEGVKRALSTNPNLTNFKQWETIDTAPVTKVYTTDSNIYVLKLDNNVYDITDGNVVAVTSYPSQPLYFYTTSNRIITTTASKVFIQDENFNIVSEINAIDYDDSTIFSLAISIEDNLYIGTKMQKPMENTGHGILKTSLSSPTQFEEIHPNAPLSNTIFKIGVLNNSIIMTYGDHDLYNNPYPIQLRGYSHYINNKWENFTAEDVLGARNLNTIAFNPYNPENIFIASCFDGILEFQDNLPVNVLDKTNSGLEAIENPSDPDNNDTRVTSVKFDNDGILWSTSNLISNPLKSYNTDTKEWTNYNFNSIIATPFSSDTNFSEIAFGNSNRTIWIGGLRKGIIGLRKKDTKLVNIDSKEKNLPAPLVKAIAVDKKNSVWLGTYKGLRVIYNQDEFFNNPNYQLDDIIIEEDGVAKELLYQQSITDIVVDGSNNKWIATLSTGVFFVTEDGQQTLAHFTTDNSPLPSNNVLDLEFDETTGLIYMATKKGLVAYNSGSSVAKKTLEEAFVYPNPVRPTFNMATEKIKIKNISENANIKITDIAGNLVAEAQTKVTQKYSGLHLEIDGGTAFWNGKNLMGTTVASGIYIVFISDLDSNETKTLKIMVVR